MKKLIYTMLAIMLPFGVFAQKLDRSHLPPAGPAPVIKLKDPVIFHLINGMTVLVVEDHRFPIVTASVSIDQGPVLEGSKAGVMSILGEMLAEGTAKMDKAQFDAAIDILGAKAEFNSSGANLESLKSFFPKALQLVAEALETPAMTETAFEKLRVAALTNLKSEDRNVDAISARVINSLAYGKAHPDGEFVTIESLQALTIADVRDAYQRYITPSRAYLTIVGDISARDAGILATAQFENWKGNALNLPKLVHVDNPARSEIDVVNVPTAVQSEITLVNLNDLQLTSQDFFAAQVANMILGGGSDAHLFKSLREKRGFTYGAYSSIGAGRYQTLFEANAAVRTAKTDSAVSEFMTQIKSIREQPVTEEELKNAKALFNGSFALNVENPSVTANYARNILMYHLPKDYYRNYLQNINAVTATDIQHAAQKYFSYYHTRIVVVGNSTQFLENLKKLPYQVNKYDLFANPSSN